MTDTIIKGTGNSRLIKSVPNLAALAPTYDKLLEMLSTEGLPADILGPYAVGVSTMGTGYSKGEVLPNTLCSNLGLPTSATPAQALEKLRTLTAAAQSTANKLSTTKAQAQVVSYVGTGEYGENSPTSITFSFAPKLVIHQVQHGNFNNTDRWCWISDSWSTEFTSIGFGNSSSGSLHGKKSSDGRTFTWYNTSRASYQNNERGTTYRYIGIG